MDFAKRFTGRANDYAKYRPSYPQELFRFLKEKCGLKTADVVADVGAGTGIFTAGLLDTGFEVFAVEPNDDMRAQAEKSFGNNPAFHAVKGSAEDTKIEKESVSLVTAAQSFHWFCVEKFAQECSRILKPLGEVALVWNNRDYTSCLEQEYQELCRQYCPEYRGPSGGKFPGTETFQKFFQDGVYAEFVFPNDIFCTCEEFIGRNLSSSYALRQEDERYALFIQAQEKLFAKYAKDGILTLKNAACLYLGTVSKKEITK